MKKRIILLLTVAVLIINMFCVNTSFAQTSEDDKYIEFLRGLDIWNSYISDNFDDQRYMYRGEYIKSILNIISYVQSSGVELTKEQEETAESLGLIADKNNVDANMPVKLQDALKISVNAMGYTKLAEYYGGYPSGYITVAGKLKILDGVNADNNGYLTRGNAARLIYNTALGSPLITYAYTNDGMSFSDAYSDISMLEYYRDISEVDGIVTATPLSNIYSENGVDKGYIRIGDNNYKTDLDNADELIGMYVKAYVFKDGTPSGKVLYAEPDNPKEVLKIRTEDIKSVDTKLQSLSYIDSNNKRRTVSINPGAAVLYNGVLCESCTAADFMAEGGVVELIDNDASAGGYDVVRIWISSNVLVDSVSIEGKSVQNIMTYDASLSVLKVDEDKSLITFDGKNISLSDIKHFDLLEVYLPKNSNSEYVWINVNRNEISGTVSLHSNGKVFLDGETYEFSPNYKKAENANDEYAPSLNAGDNYRIFVDSYGRICAAKGNNDGTVYALLTKVKYDDKGLNKAAYLRVLTEDDMWIEYPVNEKPVINDDSCSLSETETILGGKVQMLKLEINAKGEVKKIWTAKETTELGAEGFTVKPEQKENYYSGNTSFKDNVYIASNPKIFVKYTSSLLNGNDEEDYFVTNLSFLKHTYQYVFKAYNVDEYNFSELFYIELPDTYDVVLRQEIYGFIVESIKKSVDSDGNDITSLYGGYYSNGMLTIPVNGDAASGIKSGDFILPVIDSQGKMKAYTKIYSLTDGETERYPISCYERDGWVQGKITKFDISGKRCLIGSENKPYRWTAATVPVYIYHKNSETVEKSDITDVETGDYVIMHYLRSTLREIIVIR